MRSVAPRSTGRWVTGGDVGERGVWLTRAIRANGDGGECSDASVVRRRAPRLICWGESLQAGRATPHVCVLCGSCACADVAGRDGGAARSG